MDKDLQLRDVIGSKVIVHVLVSDKDACTKGVAMELKRTC